MTELMLSVRDMICFSIPESIFVTIFTYILLGKFGLIDRYRIGFTLKNILIPSVGASVVLTTLSTLELGFISKIIGLFIFYILVLSIVKLNSHQNTIKLNFKILLCFAMSFFLAMIIEFVSLLLLMVLLGIDPSQLMMDENLFYTKLITSFIWIIIEFCLISIMILKKNNKMSMMLKVILKNKNLLFSTITIIILNILLIFEFVRLILFKNIFDNTQLIEQIFVTLGVVIIIPMMIILFMSFFVSTLIKQQNYYERLYHDK